MKKVTTTMMFKSQKKWKVFSDKRELQKKCDTSIIINLNEVRKILETTETYYLNNYGLSMLQGGKKIPKNDVVFQWAVLEGYRTGKREPIIAWACKNDNGKFGCARFGTKYEFDSEVANLLEKNKK